MLKPSISPSPSGPSSWVQTSPIEKLSRDVEDDEGAIGNFHKKTLSVGKFGGGSDLHEFDF